jgi:hypothetical protein
MPKSPPNIPTEAGQRVRLRAAKNRSGEVTEITTRQWCLMKWDDGGGPNICHQFELERLPIDSSVKIAV